MPEQVVMDWGLLERLCGDQPDFMRHLITLYVEDAQRDRSELRAAGTKGELAEVERIAHRMRGAAKTMGAERIALACQSLQVSARAGDDARVESVLSQIEGELVVLFALLDMRLDTLRTKP